MFIKRLKTIGGLSSLTRYVNMLSGLAPYVPTTNSTAVLLPVSASPYMQVQNWFNGSTIGFNGKYANPAVLPDYYARNSSWSRAKGYLSVSFDFSPYFRTYTFNDAIGFGTAYSNPSSLPAGGNTVGIDLQVDDSLIFLAHATSPYITGYPFGTSSGYGTKLANPATLIGSAGLGITFFNETVFVSSSATPFLHAYQFSMSQQAYGTKYADPVTLPTYGGYFAKVHPSGNAVATGYLSGAYTYAWSKTSGFGTKYAQPSGNPYAYALDFSSTGNTVIMAGGSSPFINAYPFTIAGGYGSKFSNPSTLPTGDVPYYNSVAFSHNAQAAAVLSTSSPYVYAYAFSEATGFGSKYIDPLGLLATGYFTGGIHFN